MGGKIVTSLLFILSVQCTEASSAGTQCRWGSPSMLVGLGDEDQRAGL